MGKFKLLGLSVVSSRRRTNMGCAGSKEDEDGGGGARKSAAGGASASGGGAGGSTGAAGASSAATTAASDPRIPMTAKQKYSIVASWKGIHRALEPTGVYMFVKLFEEHTELLDLFEKFKTLRTKEEQESSLELAEHASMVMSTLDHAVRTLESPDEFVQFVENVGQSHNRIPGFKRDYFWKIEKPFLEAVRTTLGDRYTDNIESIYKIAIQLIIQTLQTGFDRGLQS